jgi:large conductance mechanosensitive channel
MLREFREFLNRGNVIDLAVAVVIGAAFTQIINSLVTDIFTPIIGMIIGGIDFGGMAFQVGNAMLTYGNFLQALINFLLTAWAMFLIVQAYNRFRRKEEQTEAAVDQNVVLLTEIRDLLATNGRGGVATLDRPPSDPTRQS